MEERKINYSDEWRDMKEVKKRRSGGGDERIEGKEKRGTGGREDKEIKEGEEGRRETEE